jgi:ADP-heptose:LPS heptosyltransferase
MLHGGALGDCVLAIHLASMLRSSWQAKLTLIARSPIAKWAARHGFVDGALSLDEVGAHRWFGKAQPATDNTLSRFDRIVSLLGGPNEAITRTLSAISARPVFAVDPRPASDEAGVHITRQWARQLEEHAGERALTVPQFSTEGRKRLRDRLAARLPSGDRPIVIIHPGSGGRAKCCPIDALELLMLEFEGGGWRSAWMIGPDEVERDGPLLMNRLAASAPVLFEESVIAAADLAAGADAYIGNDAGMTHVAALAGVPTIAIFGPTDPRVWQPLGARCESAAFPTMDAANWVPEIINRVEHRRRLFLPVAGIRASGGSR